MKNLDVLQSLAKALPKTSYRNYASVVGYQDKKFYVTDGFYMLSYEPDFRDKSYPIPENDCSLNRDLIGESAVKFPNVKGIVTNVKFSQRNDLVQRLDNLINQAQFKRAKLKDQQLYLDLDRMELTRDIKDSPTIQPCFLTVVKKHLPKDSEIESVFVSTDMVKLSFSNRITAYIMTVMA